MIRDAETLDSLLNTISRFVHERLIPLERSVDENDDLHPELIQEFRELGLFGMSIPEEHGGLDVLPLNRTIYGWNFPIMIPRPGDGEFHEGIEVF